MDTNQQQESVADVFINLFHSISASAGIIVCTAITEFDFYFNLFLPIGWIFLLNLVLCGLDAFHLCQRTNF